MKFEMLVNGLEYYNHYSAKGSAREMEICMQQISCFRWHTLFAYIFYINGPIGVAPLWNKFAIRRNLKNLLAKPQLSNFYSFQDLKVHMEGRPTDMDSLSGQVILYNATFQRIYYTFLLYEYPV